jgi:hypothetical protein
MNLDVSSSVTSTTRHYDSAAALDRETINARIWLGFHFRRAMFDGSAIGHDTTRWILSRYFWPDHRR